MSFCCKKTKSSNKKESFSESKSLTITKNGATTISTSVKTTKCQNVSSSSYSEVVNLTSSSLAKLGNVKPIDFGTSSTSKMATDAKPLRPYQSQPYRSIYSPTYQPLTTLQGLTNGSRYNPTSQLSPVPTPRVNISQIVPAISDLDCKLKIAVKKSSKFYDEDQGKVPVYKTRSKNRGKLLLINNIKFINDKQERAGAQLDEVNLRTLFEEIGFKVVRHQNLTKRDLENAIKNFRDDSSLSKVDIGCVVVMSHGTGHERSDSTQVLCSDGNLVETTWIINEFNNALCKHLSGKPKILIFQCCRGNAQDVQYDAVPLTTDQRTLSDMLLAYSTVPGYVSHRDPKNGTLYIQSMCEVFMEHAHDTHVEDLLKMVDDRLSKYAANGIRQTPSFENRGFKNCYLHPKLYE